MEEIQFHATIGEDQVIRPPAGMTLPEGRVEVVVRSTAAATPSITPPSSDEEDIASLRAFLLGLAAEAELIEGSLPDDMAENHTHYAHGAPRR